MTLSRNAIGNLINRYKAVLGKCRLLNTFGSLAVAGVMVLGGAGVARGADWDDPDRDAVVTSGSGIERIYRDHTAKNLIVESGATLYFNQNPSSGPNGSVSLATGAGKGVATLSGTIQINAIDSHLKAAKTIINNSAQINTNRNEPTSFTFQGPQGATVTQEGTSAINISATGAITVAPGVTYTQNSGTISNSGTLNIFGDAVLKGTVTNTGVVKIGTDIDSGTTKLTVGKAQHDALVQGKLIIGGNSGATTLEVTGVNSGSNTVTYKNTDFAATGNVGLTGKGTIDIFENVSAATNYVKRGNATVAIEKNNSDALNLNEGTIKANNFILDNDIKLTSGTLNATGYNNTASSVSSVVAIKSGTAQTGGTLYLDGGTLALGDTPPTGQDQPSGGDIKGSLVLAGTKEYDGLVVEKGEWKVDGSISGNDKNGLSVKNGAKLTAVNNITSDKVSLTGGSTLKSESGNITVGNRLLADNGNGTIEAATGNISLTKGAESSALNLTATGTGSVTFDAGSGDSTVNNIKTNTLTVAGDTNNKTNLTATTIKDSTGTGYLNVNVDKGSITTTAGDTVQILALNLRNDSTISSGGNLYINNRVGIDGAGHEDSSTANGTLTASGVVDFHNGAQSDKLSVQAGVRATFGGVGDSTIKSVKAGTITKSGTDETLFVKEHVEGNLQLTGNNLDAQGSVALSGDSVAKNVTFTNVTDGTLGNSLTASGDMTVKDSSIVTATTPVDPTYANITVNGTANGLTVDNSTLDVGAINTKKLTAKGVNSQITGTSVVTEDLNLKDGNTITAREGNIDIKHTVTDANGKLVAENGKVDFVLGVNAEDLSVQSKNAIFGGEYQNVIGSVVTTGTISVNDTNARSSLTVKDRIEGNLQANANKVVANGAAVQLKGNNKAGNVEISNATNGVLGDSVTANNVTITNATIVPEMTTGTRANLDVANKLAVTGSRAKVGAIEATYLEAKNSELTATDLRGQGGAANGVNLTLDNATVVADSGSIIVKNTLGSTDNGKLVAEGGKVDFVNGAESPDVEVVVLKGTTGSNIAGDVIFGGDRNSTVKSVVADGEITVTSKYHATSDPAVYTYSGPYTLTVTDKLEGTLAGHTVNNPMTTFNETHYSNYIVDGPEGGQTARVALKKDNHVNNLTIKNATGSLGDSVDASGTIEMNNATIRGEGATATNPGKLADLTAGKLNVINNTYLEAANITAQSVGLNNKSEITTKTLNQSTFSSSNTTTVVQNGSILRITGDDDKIGTTAPNFSGNLIVGVTDVTKISGVADYSKAYINDNNINTPNIANARIVVKQGGLVALGTNPKNESAFVERMHQSMAAATEDGHPINAVLYLEKPVTVGLNGSITVDGTAGMELGTTYDKYTGAGRVEFKDYSLMVVNGDHVTTKDTPYLAVEDDIANNKNGEIIGLNKASLDIINAKIDKKYTIVTENYADTTDFGDGKRVTTSDILSSASYDGKGTVTVRSVSAGEVMPGLDSKLNRLLDRARRADEIGSGLVDSTEGGVRFLSRAITTTTGDGREFLGNTPAEASKAVEGAARLGTVAAVPQLAMAANSLGADAIAQRTSIAMPPTAITTIGISGGDDTAGMSAGEPYGQEGVGAWIMPLYQSTNGQGMKAGDRKVDFNGSLGGVAAGIDYTVPDTARVGVTFNMGSGETKGSGSFASTTNNMKFWGVGAYVGVMAEEMAFTADVSYTATSNDIKQKLNPKMGMGDVKADVKAQAIGAGVRAEYRYETESVDVIPHAGVRYTNIKTDEYDVKAGGMKIMKAGASEQSIWSFPVGVQFSKNVELKNGWFVKPSLDLNITPSVGDVEARNDIRFTGVSDKASMQAQTVDPITYGGQVGLEVGDDTLQLGINYNLQMGEHTTNHGVFGTFRYNF